MLTKKVMTKKETLKFKQEFSNRIIKTDTFVNLVNSYARNDGVNKAISDYMKNYEHFFVEMDVFKAMYGKEDFKFKGNRTYLNYVMDFDGMAMIMPSKIEIVLNEQVTVEKLIAFMKFYPQFLIEKSIELNENNKIAIKDNLKKILVDLNTNGKKIKVKHGQ